MDLHTNRPGGARVQVFQRPRGARVQVFQRFCVQIHEGLCANPRRFVCKSTKVCVQIHEGVKHYIMFWASWICTQTFVDLHTNLRGFAHKPSWICTQTFVDLHTNLRGFAHKPASRGQGSGFSLASRRARVQVFHWFFRFSTGCSAFSWAWGFQGSGFQFFFHGLEGPGFRIFTGLSKGQGSGFSLVFQVSTGCSGFSWAWGFQGSGFSLFFCSRARGARVQVFHWRRAPGFRFFTGFVPRGPRGQVFHWRRGPRVQVFHWTGVGAPGFRFFTSCAPRPQGSTLGPQKAGC